MTALCIRTAGAPSQRLRFFMLLIASVLTLTLAACGSSVKLDEVPVSDARGQSISPDTSGASSSTLGERGIAAVNATAADPSAAGLNLVTKVIHFDYDSYEIKPHFQSAIDAHARFLNANKSRKVALEGHTDERGGREYNLALGQKRAEAVRRAFILLGVSAPQIEAVSFGKEKPLDPQLNETAYAKNRRVELNYK